MNEPQVETAQQQRLLVIQTYISDPCKFVVVLVGEQINNKQVFFAIESIRVPEGKFLKREDEMSRTFETGAFSRCCQTRYAWSTIMGAKLLQGKGEVLVHVRDLIGTRKRRISQRHALG